MGVKLRGRVGSETGWGSGSEAGWGSERNRVGVRLTGRAGQGSRRDRVGVRETGWGSERDRVGVRLRAGVRARQVGVRQGGDQRETDRNKHTHIHRMGDTKD